MVVIMLKFRIDFNNVDSGRMTEERNLHHPSLLQWQQSQMFLDYIPPLALMSARKDTFLSILGADISANIGNYLGSHQMPADTTEM